MSINSRDECNWIAFRYVSGEMTDEESRLYEQRLVDDEAACDAVARATELHEAVRFASNDPIALRRSPQVIGRRHPAIWAAVAAACLVLAAVLLRRPFDHRPEQPIASTSENRPDSSDGEPASVSLAWAELQNMSAHEDDSSAVPQWLGTTDSQFVTGEPGLTGAGITELEVPQWLLTAVSSGSAQAKESP
jgi:hypothetical protein